VIELLGLVALVALAVLLAARARGCALRRDVLGLVQEEPGVRISDLAWYVSSDELSMHGLLRDMEGRGLVRIDPPGVKGRVWPS